MVDARAEPKARVFISYRRADGRYAVGWIQQRLQTLQHPDVLAVVRTAFSDRDLQPGEDFVERLVDEVRECAVLIVLIGPEWLGERENQAARLHDPDDWVRREIETALRERQSERDEGSIEKLVIPVLVAGAEVPQPDDLPEDVRELADLNAVRFDDPAGLEDLVRQVRDHLVTVDRRHADDAKLLDPIKAPSGRQPWWVWLAAAGAALAGGFVGYWFIRFGLTDEVRREFDETFDVGAAFLLRVATAQGAAWAALCVLGVGYWRSMLWSRVTVAWTDVARTAVLAMIIVGWAIVALGIASPLPGGGVRTWLQTMFGVFLLSPWILMLLGPLWTTPRSELLGEQLQVVATERKVMGVAVAVCVAAFVPAIVNVGVLTNDGDNQISIVVLGVFLSLLVGAALVFSHQRLVDRSDELGEELRAGYSDTYVENAAPALVDGRRDLWATLMWWATVPTLAALVTSLIVTG